MLNTAVEAVNLSLTLFATSLSGHAVFIKEAFQDQSALAFATYSSITNKLNTYYIAMALQYIRIKSALPFDFQIQ